MKRIFTAALAAALLISAVTGVTILTGRVREMTIPVTVAHAIPLNAAVALPSASSKLESAAGPGLTSGAALCAALTPVTPDAVEAAAAAVAQMEEEARLKAEAEAKAKAEAEAKAKAEAEAKAKASLLTQTMASGKTLGSGVINASDVRLRSEASTSSAILATLSKGTAVTVLTQDGSWYAVSYDGTIGYVAQQYVTMGDSLPAEDTSADTGSEDASTDSSADTGSTAPSGSYSSSAVSIAYQYLGVPYVYGGASPSGFDCSGFTMYVYSQLGVSLPHGATPQLNYGSYVGRSDLQSGDLVFFSDGSYPASHVGIYVGNDEFIHASSSSSNGYCVCISSLNSSYYSRNFVGGRRF